MNMNIRGMQARMAKSFGAGPAGAVLGAVPEVGMGGLGAPEGMVKLVAAAGVFAIGGHAGGVAEVLEAGGHFNMAGKESEHRMGGAGGVDEGFGADHEASTLGVKGHPIGNGGADGFMHGFLPGEDGGKGFGESAADEEAVEAGGEAGIVQEGDRLPPDTAAFEGFERGGVVEVKGFVAGDADADGGRWGSRSRLLFDFRRGAAEGEDGGEVEVTPGEFGERLVMGKAEFLTGLKAEVALGPLEERVFRKGSEQGEAEGPEDFGKVVAVGSGADAVEDDSGDAAFSGFGDKATEGGGEGAALFGSGDDEDDGPAEPAGEFHGAAFVGGGLVAVEEAHDAFEQAELSGKGAGDFAQDAFAAHEPCVEVARGGAPEVGVEGGVDVVGPGFVGLDGEATLAKGREEQGGEGGLAAAAAHGGKDDAVALSLHEQALKFDALAGGDALIEGVLVLAHFGDEVGTGDELGGSSAACEDEFGGRGLLVDEGEDVVEGDELFGEAVEEFVDDDEVVAPGGEKGAEGFHLGGEGSPHGGDVVGVVLTVVEAPFLFDIAKGEGGMKVGKEGEFSGFPPGLHEAEVVDAEAVAEGAEGKAEGCGGFSFAVTGVELDESGVHRRTSRMEATARDARTDTRTMRHIQRRARGRSPMTGAGAAGLKTGPGRCWPS